MKLGRLRPSCSSKEMELAAKKGIYESFKMSGPEPFYFEGKDRSFSGLKSVGKVSDDNGKELVSYAYLFTQKDKFIKFRLSMPSDEKPLGRKEIESFVKAILSEIEVPEESLFMAKMRQNERTSATK